MAEELKINPSLSRKEIYLELLPQVSALVKGEPDLVANMANLCAALKQALGFFWVGFYLVKGEELVLGPFQGSIACTRIKKGKGVCGSCWQQQQTLIVPDVDLFPGHIACSSLSRSEIVVPVYNHHQIIAVLDVDSDKVDDFSDIDKEFLEELVKLLHD